MARIIFFPIIFTILSTVKCNSTTIIPPRIPYGNKLQVKNDNSGYGDGNDQVSAGQTDVEGVAPSKANIDDKCLRCICYANTKCEAKSCVNSGPESYFCGPFQASWTYWSDGGKPTVPGGLPADHKHSFEECLKDYKCAANAVKGYMGKHKQDCNNDGVENCYDYARIHKAGPYACGGSWIESQTYWSQFLDCMNDKVQVTLPGEAPAHRETPSTNYNSNNNNRRQNLPQNNVWHQPPTAGPYAPIPTSRPSSNARLPPFAPERTQQNDNRRRPAPSDYNTNQNDRRPSGAQDRPHRRPAAVQQNNNPVEVVNKRCIQCLCYASSGCEAKKCHNAGPESYFCGPFQASWAYWKEAGSPTIAGGLHASHKHAFEECLQDYDCSVKAVQGYMRKHKKDCNRDNQINCYDFARIHKLGAPTCGTDSIKPTEYWSRLNDCMDGYVTFE